MEKFFIKENIGEIDNSASKLLAKVHKKLMTPDVITAMRAGCHFDVTLIQDSKNVTIVLKSREKVSILKTEQGVPISVIVQP
jgi:hypothetical protein